MFYVEKMTFFQLMSRNSLLKNGQKNYHHCWAPQRHLCAALFKCARWVPRRSLKAPQHYCGPTTLNSSWAPQLCS